MNNKLFKTKKPTSAYESHYEFCLNKRMQEENWSLVDNNGSEKETKVDFAVDNRDFSNWKLVKTRKPYKIATYGRFWISFGVMFMLMFLQTNRSFNQDYQRAFGAQTGYELGISSYQDNLE